MEIKSRGFRIGLIAIAGVFLVFVLYNLISGVPKIDVEQQSDDTQNIQMNPDNVGKIGDLGVGTVKNAVFYEYGKNGEVTGEFGFEKLLHERGKEWLIEKPYRKVFRENFDSFIAADQGSVLVEAGMSKPNFRDATLTGNVSIRFKTKSKSSMKEFTLYLDDITFIGERSLFTTSNSVRFESSQAEMTGAGLEVVYNQDEEKVEFLRINRIDQLRLIRYTKESKLIGTQAKTSPPADANIVAKDTPAEKPAADANVNMSQAEIYKCVLSGNVEIETLQEMVLANQIFINNILFEKAKQSAKASDQDPNSSQQPDTEPNQTTAVAVNDDANQPAAPDENAGKTRDDIVVRCTGGLVVVPMTSTFQIAQVAPADKKLPTDNEKIVFAADQIDYDAAVGDVNATGPSTLRFYAKDFTGPNTPSGPNTVKLVPVTVTSLNKVWFTPTNNKVVFDGKCEGKMLDTDGLISQEHALFADRLLIDLYKADGEKTNVKHFAAVGGNVKLRSVKRQAAENVLGWVKLNCDQFDYDMAAQQFVAAGNGEITLDSSMSSLDGTKESKFSLKKPCWAIVRDFETLKYSLGNGTASAEGKEKALSIDYIPAINGETGDPIYATAGKMDAEIADVNGQSELLNIHATDGITYKEQRADKKGADRSIEFIGSDFLYDKQNGEIRAWGNDLEPCLLNNAKVDGIRYELNSGRLFKAKIVGPGMLQ